MNKTKGCLIANFATVPSGQAADIAAQINAARRAEYQKVANSSGASLADVEAMAGKKAMERTPAGQYVQVGGKWVKK